MPQSRAVVWMDSKEAHVFRFGLADVEEKRLKAHSPFRKVRHKAGAIGTGRAAVDLSYFDHVADALRSVQEWLLVGPGQSKTAFLHHVETHMPQLRQKLVGVEAMDHPSDGELIDHARRVFKAADRLRPNSPPVRGSHSAA